MSVNPSTLRYSLDGGLPEELIGAVDSGTNLLVSGASMTGKQRLTYRLLAEGATERQGTILVTTREDGSAALSNYQSTLEDVPGTDAGQPRWCIDCVGSGGDGDRVRSVSSPGDLTGIGIEFSEVARQAVESDVHGVRVGVDSLSPLLLYADVQRVFRFLHVFTSQIQSRDWLGLFLIDSESHDSQVVNTVRQLFDGMIELRQVDDRREVRVRGLGSGTSEWHPFE